MLRRFKIFGDMYYGRIWQTVMTDDVVDVLYYNLCSPLFDIE
jgi:hypothetical protein